MKTMVWEPRQAHSEEAAQSLCGLASWQDHVVSRLGSKQTSSPRSVLSGGAWHKVRSNLLKADSEPVCPVIPRMELLERPREKANLLSIFLLTSAQPNSNKCIGQQYYVEPRIWPNIS